MVETVRILSIDGGGIREIIPTMVLQAILPKTKAQDAFHIIAGNSTGGVIATGLSKPNPLGPKEIQSLYVEHGHEIFGNENPFHFVKGPRYSADALESQLKANLGNTYLSQVKDTELLVPSYAISLPKPVNGSTCAPMFFRSWQAKGIQLTGKPAKKKKYDFKLAEIARATSAAPTYFPPARIHDRAGQAYTMIDGAMFANNPTIAAIVEAYRLYYSADLHFLVVSLGTGSVPLQIDADAAASWWGDVFWASPIISILMDGNSQTVEFEAQELFGGDQYTRLDISLATVTPKNEIVDPAMDNASPGNIKALQDKAQQLIDTQKNQIKSLAEELAKPKDALSPKPKPPAKSLMDQLRGARGKLKTRGN